MTDLDLRRVVTRREAAEELARIGVVGEAAEAILRETAPARHAWRVAQTIEAARAAAPSPRPVGMDLDAYAAGLLVLDLLGIGGREGVEGLGTLRVPALAVRLGRGRWQATDGDAYRAAAREAISQLNEGGGYRLQIGPVLELDDTARTPAILVEIARDRGATLSDPGLLPWLRTAAREGLRCSLGLGSWWREDSLPPVAWSGRGEEGESWGTPAHWAGCVNAIEEALSSRAQPIVLGGD